MLRPYLERIGVKWTEYANHSDPAIQTFENWVGIFLMLASICFLTLKPNKSQRVQKTTLAVAGVFTSFHILLKYWGHNCEWPMIPEYALQGATPWLFLAFLPYFPANKDDEWKKPSANRFFVLKVALAMCFIGHGLYALGWPYQPVKFVRMVVTTFPFLEFKTASHLVTLIGIFDLLMAVTIFIKPIERQSLYHMFLWGSVTALARVISYVIVPMNMHNINPWLLETTVRTIHGGAPLFAYLLLKHQIIDQDRKLRWSLPPTLKTKTAAVGAIFSAILLSAIIQNHRVMTSKQEDYWAERRARLQREQQQSISRRDSTDSSSRPKALSRKDFSTTSSGKVYSDNLFYTPDLPVRLTLDLPAKTTDVWEKASQISQPFVDNRDIILSSVRSEIVKNFRQHSHSKHKDTLTEEQIIKFVKQAKFLIDGEDTLSVTVDAPWLYGRTITFQLNTMGSLIGAQQFTNS